MEREAIINFNKNKRYFYIGNISTYTSWLNTKYFHTNGLKKIKDYPRILYNKTLICIST